MMQNNDENKFETFVKCTLPWLIFKIENPTLFVGEPFEPKLVEHVYDDLKLSQTLFPSVLRVIQTGSRAEKTFLSGSDFDNIFEIGPGVVFEKNLDIIMDKIVPGRGFYWTKTSNDGYYRIEDQYGDFLYPKILQVKVGSLLMVGKGQTEARGGLSTSRGGLSGKSSVKDDGATKASLPDGNEDQIIAMRLATWPIEIWNDMEGKLKWRENLKDSVKGSPLFFVPKHHPNSEKPKVEWRLSFSVPEKEIMLALPSMHKRAFMICKSVNKESCSAERNIKTLTTFHWKTALLWKLDEYDEAMLKSNNPLQVYDLVKALVEYLHKAVKDKKLCNYFTPEMNLFEDYSKDELEFAEKSLVNFTVNLNKVIECCKLPLYDWNEKTFSLINDRSSNLDVTAMSLYEGYYNFQSDLFEFSPYFPTTFTRDFPLQKTVVRREEYYHFVLEISGYFSGLPPPPKNKHGDLEFIVDIQNEFPLVVLLQSSVGQSGSGRRYSAGDDRKLTQFLCSTQTRHSRAFQINICILLRLYINLLNITDVKLKPSVLKYLKIDTGEIYVNEMIDDILEYIKEKGKNDVMVWCDAIVCHLKDCFERNVLNVEEYLKAHTLANATEFLITPIDLFVKCLKESLEEKNNDWMGPDIKVTDGIRTRVTEFLQKQHAKRKKIA